jgi:hypothetical protein
MRKKAALLVTLLLAAQAVRAQTAGCIYSWQPGTIVARTSVLLPGPTVVTSLTLLASGLGANPATCDTEPGDCKIIECSADAAKKGVPCEDVVLPSCVREQIVQCSPGFIPYIRKIVVDAAGSSCP